MGWGEGGVWLMLPTSSFGEHTWVCPSHMMFKKVNIRYFFVMVRKGEIWWVSLHEEREQRHEKASMNDDIETKKEKENRSQSPECSISKRSVAKVMIKKKEKNKIRAKTLITGTTALHWWAPAQVHFGRVFWTIWDSFKDYIRIIT